MTTLFPPVSWTRGIEKEVYHCPRNPPVALSVLRGLTPVRFAMPAGNQMVITASISMATSRATRSAGERYTRGIGASRPSGVAK
jgi:hypothetical protein